MTAEVTKDLGGLNDQSWKNLVVMVSGVSWDDTWLVEKHMALQLSKYAPVLYVDPPMSWLTPLRKPQLARDRSTPRLHRIGHNLVRLTPLAPPGLTRPILRDAAMAATRLAIRRAVRRLDTRVHAMIACSLDPSFAACDADIRVLWGTDDWVAGASLMGLSDDRLRRQESAQLEQADVVVAVSSTLSDRWRSRSRKLVVIGNGCDADAFANSDDAPDAADIQLPDPIAGYFGHLSERIDVDLLTAVADSGHSLLLVGRRQLTFDISNIDKLLARENVQWVGPQPFEQLPSYMKRVRVGLTPYTDTPFNRSSFPLKTLEYLAAGRGAIMTDLPSAHQLPQDLVTVCQDARSFRDATVAALESPTDSAVDARRRQFAVSHSWTARGRDFADVLGI